MAYARKYELNAPSNRSISSLPSILLDTSYLSSIHPSIYLPRICPIICPSVTKHKLNAPQPLTCINLIITHVGSKVQHPHTLLCRCILALLPLSVDKKRNAGTMYGNAVVHKEATHTTLCEGYEISQISLIRILDTRPATLNAT